MALPLGLFKSPSEISLPLSFSSDKGLNGIESKRNTIFRARRKNSRQSRSSIDTQPAQQTISDQVCPYLCRVPLIAANLLFQSIPPSTMCLPFANRHKVQAVRVNPQGFILSEKRPRFETIMISQNDEIFSLSPSSLSEVLGIKVVGRPLNNAHKDPSMRRLSNTNYDAQHLFRCCVVNKVDDIAASHSRREWDRQFGEYELPYDMMGPMILARSDKGPFHILHAMAMLNFAENIMSPEFDDYQHHRKSWRVEETHFEHQRVVMTRRLEIARKANRKGFEFFWKKFKQQTVHGYPELLVEDDETTMQQQMELWMVNRDELEPRPEWASVPSPYDVTNKTRRLSFKKLSI
jgi:hypothetical protein